MREKKNHVVMPNASKSHGHSPARAEVERVGPLEGSRSGGGRICRTTGVASAAVSGVAMHVVSLDNAIRAGSMSIFKN